MPIYEYRCGGCRHRFSVFCKIQDLQEHVPCEHCKSENTHRMVSRFKTIRSEDQIMESMADPSVLSGIDENDPRSIAKWAKKMAREMGEDMGDEIEAMAEEELAKAGKPGCEGPAGHESGETPDFPPSGMPPMPAGEDDL